jgi:ubiquinone biosynthesis protein
MTTQNSGFELLQERPPQSLLRRLFVTLRHLAGLVLGGGVAFVRTQRVRGQENNFSVLLVRLILLLCYPLLDKSLVCQPFPVQFRLRLELLGPTYIKLGQILSLREDVLPKAITAELQNLLDRLPVVTFARYQELIQADLGRPVAELFPWIDPTPLGSASLAQIHRARLFTGEEVVLKVIKPGVRETIEQDVILLRILGWVLQGVLPRYQPQRLINEFCNYTLREVDLRFEADNAETFTANFAANRAICFPHIYRDYSGEAVLCMEFFDGVKPNAASAALLSPQERGQILDLGVSAIIQMIFYDGFFHADLHPGNMVIFADLRIGFIDLGMVGRVDEETRKGMLHYFHSLVMSDPENAARILTSIALAGPDADLTRFRRELADLNRRWIGASRYHRFSIAELILRSVNLAGRYGTYYPEEIILMAKALVTIEGVGNLLAPDLELTALARSHIQTIIRREFDPVLLWRKAAINAPEFLEIVQRSPMIIAHALQRLDRLNQLPRAPLLPGLKETVLAGFCLVAVAVLVTSGAAWWLWVAILVVAVVLGVRGLMR